MSKRKTKIVCTIGPTCEDLPTVKKLLEAGMNVARFNFSHGSHDDHEKRIQTILQASKETGIPVATLLDTKGPQLRTEKTNNDEKIVLEQGALFTLRTDGVPGTNEFVSINHHLLPKEVYKDTKILIADGLIELVVLETSDSTITCRVVTGGSFGSNKNVNVIGANVSLPTVTEADVKDIAFGASMNMDFVAASFVQSADDVRNVQNVLDENNSPMAVIAKIETTEAIKNIHSIVLASSGIMVARGDLGVQLKTEEVPLAQKTIIRICNQYGRAVITATQMLESMIVNPRPTRAEATDVANAIFDGTDAIMLSAETANGKYPIEAVQTMHNIALTVENSRDYQEQSKRYFELHKDGNNIGSATAKAACILATDTKSCAIIAPSLRGNSPRILSQFRPQQVIVATTTYESIYRRLLIYWGVYPFLLPETEMDIEHIINASIQIAKEHNILKKYDFVTITAGLPLGSPIMLNTVQLRFVGSILQRGSQGYGTITEGVVYNIHNIQKARQFIKDKENIILVCDSLEADDFQLLRHAQGIICSSYLRAIDDLIYNNPHIVLIADIHSKSMSLEDGQRVGLLGTEKIVYELETDHGKAE